MAQGHGGECRETKDGREYVIPQGEGEQAGEKKGQWEERDGRKERDEQDGGVQFLEGLRRVTTGIPGSTSVTMAGTTTRCTTIAPQFTVLARKNGIVCFTITIQASPLLETFIYLVESRFSVFDL